MAFENVAPDSSRNLVRVQWSGGVSNSYRLGFQGTVDLTCLEEEVGPFYYRDHLPLLGESFLKGRERAKQTAPHWNCFKCSRGGGGHFRQTG